MAKKGQRSWFTTTPERATLAAVDTPVGITIVEGNEEAGVVPQGKLKLQRLLMCVQVFFDGLVAGSIDEHLWIGLVRKNVDDTSIPHIFQTGADRDDNYSWLWREPVPFHSQVAIAGGGDYNFACMCDWKLRGGKGTEVDSAVTIAFVAERVLIASGVTMWSSVSVSPTALELYWGS